MINVIRICAEYQVGAVAVDCFEAVRDFCKTSNIYKIYFHCYCPNVFSKLVKELFKGLQAYDTRYRHFWIKLKQLQITVLKQSHNLSNTFFFLKEIFIPIVQMCFQRFSEWVLRLRTYDTRCLHFLPNIKLEELLITFLKRSRDFSKPNNVCRVKFNCYVQMCFQSFSGCFIGFTGYDTRYLHFY